MSGGHGHEKAESHAPATKKEKSHGSGGDLSKVFINESIGIATITGVPEILKGAGYIIKTPFMIAKGIFSLLRAGLALIGI